MDFRGQVWKRVWKMEYFGLKLDQDFGNRAAHPYQKFWGVPPPPPPGPVSQSKKAPKRWNRLASRSIPAALVHKTRENDFCKNDTISMPSSSSNAIKQNQNQSCLARTPFPALAAGYMYLLPILIGSLRCFCLFLVLSHSIENNSSDNLMTTWKFDRKYFDKTGPMSFEIRL